MKIKVTGTHKWHITGDIIDANPAPAKVPEDYFEQLVAAREEKKRIQAEQEALRALQEEERLRNEEVAKELKNHKENSQLEAKAFYSDLAGMAFIALGMLLTLRQIYL